MALIYAQKQQRFNQARHSISLELEELVGRVRGPRTVNGQK